MPNPLHGIVHCSWSPLPYSMVRVDTFSSPHCEYLVSVPYNDYTLDDAHSSYSGNYCRSNHPGHLEHRWHHEGNHPVLLSLPLFHLSRLNHSISVVEMGLVEVGSLVNLERMHSYRPVGLSLERSKNLRHPSNRAHSELGGRIHPWNCNHHHNQTTW